MRISSPVKSLVPAVFAASLFGIELTPATLAAGAAVAIAMSLGSVGLPGGVMFMAGKIPVFTAMGVPIEVLGPMLAVEPIPDTIWGSVEGGAYRNTDDSYRFGDYTGLKDDAWYGLANVELHGRAPWQSDDTWHFDLQGSNLALDSRFIALSGGLQGLFDVWFEWDQIPRYDDDTASLVWERAENLPTMAEIRQPQLWLDRIEARVPAGT